MALLASSFVVTAAAFADPTITRLTPPSALFTFGADDPPIIARFLPGQRFDFDCTVTPDAGGHAIVEVEFEVDGVTVPGTTTSRAASATAGATDTCWSLRAYSNNTPGIHTFKVRVTQDDSATAEATGNFEIVSIAKAGLKAKNVIFCIGDGMGIAHRTAARIMLHGVQQGKPNSLLNMDKMSNSALITTASLNSIVTDSAPGAACYSTGNKSNNNQQGVFPDDTTDNFDNPRVELIGEYLKRTQGKSLGIVTTSDVFDATPGAFGSHTQARSAGTGICDQYLDERGISGLTVLLGGGRKWFLPSTTPGSARSASNDYVLSSDITAAWGVPAGALDPTRDLIGDFIVAGYTYAADRTALQAVGAGTSKLLGLFSLSNMNVAKDKIDGRRGDSTVVNDYLFPDQPMLDEMTEKALGVLNKNSSGFVLMVEAASIDKQAHNMDTERWILDTIEFDYAIKKCLDFQQANPDTLVIVTADHECAGVNIIGGSRVTNADLQTRAASGGGAAQLRTNVVGTYESAGFPIYAIDPDGYPATTDPDFKMLIGYAANADRFEDWLTNQLPLRDSQQPNNGTPPLNTYPTLPTNRDTAGNFSVTGQIADTSAAHTGSDIPLTAHGRGATLFNGVMDNTDVFFKAMQAAVGGVSASGTAVPPAAPPVDRVPPIVVPFRREIVSLDKNIVIVGEVRESSSGDVKVQWRLEGSGNGWQNARVDFRQFYFDFNRKPEGSYTVEIVAIDSSGNRSPEAKVRVTRRN